MLMQRPVPNLTGELSAHIIILGDGYGYVIHFHVMATKPNLAHTSSSKLNDEPVASHDIACMPSTVL